MAHTKIDIISLIGATQPKIHWKSKYDRNLYTDKMNYRETLNIPTISLNGILRENVNRKSINQIRNERREYL